MNINEVFDLAIQVEEKLSECYKEIGHLCRDELGQLEGPE